ncbi:ECF transporter S component [Thermophagus sp. OGC60D27]|uniref:ECF transporter S component n=1 Tax=Thermophagus sp. OGC60D27 TaxID=3458415 RepID=UPI004037ACE8
MEATAVKLYSLEYKDAKTYLVTLLFVTGNIVFPQLCHLANLGPVLLPIYFFTLIAAYKYGWKAGVLTALLSPVANSLLFGMPLAAALPAIMSKSLLLAGFAGFAAYYFKKVSVLILLGVVLFSQIVGTLIEWAMVKDFFLAVQDFRLGLPGMAFQILGGFLMIKLILKK